MKARNWNELAKELENLVYSNYEPARVNVVVINGEKGNPDGIKVYPKQGRTIHVAEQIVDFCRCKQLCNYITCEEKDDELIASVMIF